MPDPILDPLNVTTLKEIYPAIIEDLFFLNAPFLAHMRAKALVPFGGGAFMQNDFAYGALIGGFYQPGDNFNIDVVDVLSATIFDPKYVQVTLSEYLENMLVTNKGPLAVFSLVNTKLRIAMNTISAIVAVALNRHGQPSGSGVVGNRPKAINGTIEAYNNGTDPGWEGSIFTAYGTQARNGVVGDALNSTPYWNGTSAGAAAPIGYPVIEETYQDCCRGAEEPDLGIGNKAVFAYIKERIQTQQIYQQERDPFYGSSGFKINNAMFLKDDYFPSLKYGKNQPLIGNWLTSSFTSPASPTSASNFPSATSCTVSELFMWFNTSKWMLRIANDPEFGFGWSGFVRAQDGTRVAGQVKAGLNAQCRAPWSGKQVLGING